MEKQGFRSFKFSTRFRRGFTLVELLIVVAIIGILATIIIISYTNAQARARDNKRKSDIQALSSAIEMYYTDKKIYPWYYESRSAGAFYRVRSVNDELSQARWTDGFSESTAPKGAEGLLSGYISIPLPQDPREPKAGFRDSPCTSGCTTWMAPDDYYTYTYLSTKSSYLLAARLEVDTGSANGNRFKGKTLKSHDGTTALVLPEPENLCSFLVPEDHLFFVGNNLVKDTSCPSPTP